MLFWTLVSTVQSHKSVVRAAFPDDGDVATLYRLVAAMFGVGGAISALQATADRQLSRSERARAQVLGLGFAAVGIAGAATRRSGALVARLVRAAPPATIVAGLAPVASAPALGGARTPMHFVGAVTAAVTGSLVGRRRAAWHNAVASAIWLAQAQWDRTRNPDREQPEPLWSHVVYPLSLFAGGVLGAAGGDAALRARSLQHTLHRFEGHVADLEGLRAELLRSADEYLKAVDEFKSAAARQPDASRRKLLDESAERSRERLADVLAVLHVSERAGRGSAGPLDELADAVARAETSPESVRVEVQGDSANASLSPREQLAAHLFLLRSINNARRAGAATAVIHLARRAPLEVTLEVHDDAGDRRAEGPFPPGKGTRDTQQRLALIGGQFELRRDAQGTVAIARIQLTDTTRAREIRPLADQLVGLLDRAVWDVIRIDAAMVLAMAWLSAQYLGRHRRRSQLIATALMAAAEVINRLPVKSPRRIEALLAATALAQASSPHGPHAPLSGWAGVLLSSHAIHASTRRSALFATALATGAVVSYRGPRSEFLTMFAREGIGMVLGGLAAARVRAVFRPVEQRERRLHAVLAELEELQGVAEQIAYRSHGFAEPIENAVGLMGGDPSAQLVLQAAGALRDTGRELSRAVDNRRKLVDEIAEALAYRSWPAPVEVTDDVRPLALPSAQGIVGGVLDRRRVLDSIGLIGDHVLTGLQPGPLGGWPLDALELWISDTGEQELLVSVAPRPRRLSRRSRVSELSRVLAPLGGSVREGFDDGRLTFAITLTTPR